MNTATKNHNLFITIQHVFDRLNVDILQIIVLKDNDLLTKNSDIQL